MLCVPELCDVSDLVPFWYMGMVLSVCMVSDVFHQGGFVLLKAKLVRLSFFSSNLIQNLE